MNIEEQERSLSYARGQFEIAKMYALYWHAMATTGIAVLRNTAQGREPTEEEKRNGQVISWREHTDQEKIQNALNTMNRHIQRMNELNDFIAELTA